MASIWDTPGHDYSREYPTSPPNINTPAAHRIAYGGDVLDQMYPLGGTAAALRSKTPASIARGPIARSGGAMVGG